MDLIESNEAERVYKQVKDRLLDIKFDLNVEQTNVETAITILNETVQLKANIESPSFTGIPLAPTAESNTNTSQIATTAFVQTAISNLINHAPAALDTLDELAAALGDDANFATTVLDALSGKLATNSADYIKSLSIDGTTLTYTLGNNTTGTLTTQNTTYATMTAEEATTGTGTTGLLISPKILNDKIEEKIPTNISTFTNDSGYLTAVSWSDVSSKPSTFAPSAHNQASDTINLLTGYSKPNSTSALATTDTLNEALGKLEKALDGKQASGSYLTTTSTAADSDKLGGTDATDYALKTDLSTDAATVTGHTVATDVPSGAVFTDTHYTANLITGASSSADTNAAATDDNVYLNLVENSTVRNSHNIKGASGSNINVTSNVNGDILIGGDVVGVCSTASGTGTKIVTVNNFVLKDGAIVRVRFENRNSNGSPGLNVNNTGTKPIYVNWLTLNAETNLYEYSFQQLISSNSGILGPTNPYVTFMYDANLGSAGAYKIIDSPNIPTIYPFQTPGRAANFSAQNFYPIATNNSLTTTKTGLLISGNVRYQCTTGHAAIAAQGEEGTEGYVAAQAAIQGIDSLILGNVTAYPSEGNSKGVLTLYSPKTTYFRIFPPENLGASSSYYLPEVRSTGSATYPYQMFVVADNVTTTGSVTQPVYVQSDGHLAACTYTLNADVPSNAVFTDTTYGEATTSTAGLMSALDKDKLDTIDMSAITKLQQVLTKESNQTNSCTWEVGSFTNANGTNYASTNRIRTQNFLKCSQYTRISVDANYKYGVLVYSTNATSGYLGKYNGTDTLVKSTVWLTSPMWIHFNNNYYIRVILAQDEEGTMTTDEKAHVQIYGFN